MSCSIQKSAVSTTTPVQSRPTLRRFGIILAGLATLVLAEWGASQLMPRVPGSDRVPRNPYRYRGWPEYLSGLQPAATNGQCVLISNCQGYGGEYDGRMIYSVELARRLSATRLAGHANWTVHNWSVDGATSIDYLFAAAWLTRRHPDITLAVTGYADYLAVHAQADFGYSRTDLPRFLNDAAVRRALPASFRQRHGQTEAYLSFCAQDASALLRAGDFAWSWIERRMPGILNAWYAPNMPYLPWHLPRTSRTWLSQLPRPGPSGDGTDTIPLDYDASSTAMLAEYLDLLQRQHGRVVVVAEPYQHRNHPSAQLFLQDVARLASARSLEFWDLSAAVPDDEFKTTAHLSRTGHVRLAELLSERLARLPDATQSAAGSPIPGVATDQNATRPPPTADSQG